MKKPMPSKFLSVCLLTFCFYNHPCRFELNFVSLLYRDVIFLSMQTVIRHIETKWRSFQNLNRTA